MEESKCSCYATDFNFLDCLFFYRITDFGFVHGEESVQAHLEFWLGNITVTIDGQKTKFASKRLKDLAREPVKFKHQERNWLLKLGADAESKQFLLFINGVSFEELPEWDDKGICKSSMENNWKTNIK